MLLQNFLIVKSPVFREAPQSGMGCFSLPHCGGQLFWYGFGGPSNQLAVDLSYSLYLAVWGSTALNISWVDHHGGWWYPEKGQCGQCGDNMVSHSWSPFCCHSEHSPSLEKEHQVSFTLSESVSANLGWPQAKKSFRGGQSCGSIQNPPNSLLL